MKSENGRRFHPKQRNKAARLICFAIIAVVGVCICSSITAATFTDANWVSLGSLPGANGPAYATIVDDLGNLYIGGSFTSVGGVAATNIAKWNGSSWSALGSGVTGAPPGYFPTVQAFAIAGSNLYVGGYFLTAGGSPVNQLAKWNGSSWSLPGFGNCAGQGSDYVYALAVSGGNHYAGGRVH